MRLGKTVEELLSGMSSAEFGEWMAYEAVTGPLGLEREDLLAGIVATQAGCNLFVGEGKDAVGPLDVIPDWGGQRAAREAEGEMARNKLNAEAWLAWGRGDEGVDEEDS